MIMNGVKGITKTTALSLLSMVVCSTLLPPPPADALTVGGFKAGNIISDPVFTDKNSMSASQIQAFLNAKVPNCDTNGQQNSEMNNAGVPDYNGNGSIQRWEWGKKKYNQTIFKCLRNYTQGGKTAATIIRNVAIEFSINPQVLIVLLQKEQGLVTDTWPLNQQYKTAAGYGCPDTAPCATQYYGFTNQVRWAARMFRAIMNGDPDWYTPYTLGTQFIQYNPNSSCGGKNVKIENRATQALYNYTPYQPNAYALGGGSSSAHPQCGAFGNRNFYSYFREWFGSTQQKNNIRLITCSGESYLVERGIARKRHITDEAKVAWNFPDEYFVNDDPGCEYLAYDEDLDRLVRSRATGKVYFVDLGKARYVPSQSIADSWGLGSLESRIPKLESDSITDNLITGLNLNIVVESDNPSVSKVFVINGGNRYLIAGTSSGDNSSLRLVSGYNTSMTQEMSVSSLTQTLNPIEHPTQIDYAFQVGSTWYLLDHGKLKKVTDPIAWAGYLSGPVLTSDILKSFSNIENINTGFIRNKNYHLLSGSTSIMSSPDQPVGQAWGVGGSPVITQLLTNKILGATTENSVIRWLYGNVRLIECSGDKFVVERNIRLKRLIEPAAIPEWGFDDKYFAINDPGCSYATYGNSLDRLVRSRKTESLYYVQDGRAYRVLDQTTATNWGLGTFTDDVYPRFNSESITDTLRTGYHLPESP